MNQRNHVARWIAAGVGVLALAGAGTVAATTEPPTDTMAAADTSATTGDTSMGSEPTTGAGPSDCPAITGGAEGTAAAEGTVAEGTAAAEDTAAEGTDAAAGTDAAEGTDAAAGTEVMATETTGATDATAGDTVAVDVSAPPMAGPAVQIVETDEFGPILVDGACFTLYGFTPDVDGEPTCVDECAAQWPPFFVAEEVPALADELDPSLFSVVEHQDGPMLKVGDWPLYYFAGDTAPGDMNGQGIGGVWWVVAPDGTLIETAEDGEGTEAAEGTDAAETTAAADTATETTTG